MSNFLDDLKNDHRNFDSGKLEGHFGSEPWDLFHSWYKEAFEKKVNEPNAMSICTVSPENQPSTRIVYLKEVQNNEFIFYTNYHSTKGRDISYNPLVSLLFFWPEMERQIRVHGFARKVDPKISDDYFESRPRMSQLGAYASRQSEVLESRADLENRLIELDKKFPTKVPRPEFWGGYKVEPSLIEFWQGRPSRLHDRIVYQKQEENWEVFRKNP